MGLLDRESKPTVTAATPRPPRHVSEFESEIRQLYVRLIDEPVPPRLIGILRAGLAGPKR